VTVWFIVSFSVSAAALLIGLASLLLVGRTRAKIHKLACHTIFRSELDEKLEPLEAQLTFLSNRLTKLDEAKTRDAEWAAQAENLNLNRRGQVIRMYRRGESTPGIAAALRMPRADVALMIKVFEISKEAEKFEGEAGSAI
jgi:hypothetical protein